MKKLLTALCITSAFTIAAHAADQAKESKEKKADGKRPEWTEEQKTLRKEMIAKYDTNKDGKLDKEERAKISQEDRAKMKDLRPKKSE